MTPASGEPTHATSCLTTRVLLLLLVPAGARAPQASNARIGSSWTTTSARGPLATVLATLRMLFTPMRDYACRFHRYYWCVAPPPPLHSAALCFGISCARFAGRKSMFSGREQERVERAAKDTYLQFRYLHRTHWRPQQQRQGRDRCWGFGSTSKVTSPRV